MNSSGLSAGRRLFYALWPDQAVRDALQKWQSLVLPPGARPHHLDDLHLTLHFLGQVSEERLPRLVEIGEALSTPGFDLVLDRLEVFARPRVLWAGPQSWPRELDRLHEYLSRELASGGFRVESRSFRPHLTLARKVDHRPNVGKLDTVSWQVRRWALVESCSGARPMYRQLAQWVFPEN